MEEKKTKFDREQKEKEPPDVDHKVVATNMSGRIEICQQVLRSLEETKPNPSPSSSENSGAEEDSEKSGDEEEKSEDQERKKDKDEEEYDKAKQLKNIWESSRKSAASISNLRCGGWIYMQKNTGKWKKLWCEYSSGHFTHRTKDTGRVGGDIPVSFVEAEISLSLSTSSHPSSSVLSTSSVLNSSNHGVGGVGGGGPLPPQTPTATGSTSGTGSSSSASPSSGSSMSATSSGLAAIGTLGSAFMTAIGTSTSNLTTSLMTKDKDREHKDSSSLSSGGLSNGLGVTIGTDTESKLDGSGRGGLGERWDERYFAYLEEQDASYAFKLFSPTRVYVMRADTEQLRNEFVTTITQDLKKRFSPELWRAKEEALKEINPLLREQFMTQVDRYNALVKSLAKTFMEEELPITSTRKEKSGVLAMETPHELTEWRDFYFVLFEGSLFYYKDSKSTTPTGFVTLKHATLALDPKRLTKGEFVFVVKTPLRIVVCKTKHAVALSEWVACLESTLTQTGGGGKKKTKSASKKVLDEINKLVIDLSSFSSLLSHPVGLQHFRKFLEQERKDVNAVDFYLATEEFSNIPPNSGQISIRSQKIYTKFLSLEAKQKIVCLPPALLEQLRESNQSDPEMYDVAKKFCYEKLTKQFERFKSTKEFNKLNVLLGKRADDDKRDVDPFDPTHVQSFVLRVKGQKKSKDIKFVKKQTIFTIGRDKSNTLVIEDSRVSRSHARVEYSDTQCEYIDLGSSCGSKLNGKPVLRAKLRPGDVIEIGQSTLIFQVKKKKRAFPFSI